MNKYKELLSNTVVFLIGNVSSKVVLFFLIPLYTKYLSSDQYGAAELLITTCDIVMPIITLGMNNSIFRFTMDEKYSEHSVLKCYYFVFSLSVVLACAFSFGVKFIPSIHQFQIFFIIITCLSAINEGYGLYIKARGKTIQYAIDNFIYAFSLLAFNYYFLVIKNSQVAGYFYSMIMAKLVSIVFLYIYGNSPKAVNFFKYEKKILSEMLRFSIPLIGNSIFWWIVSYSDRYMLSFMLNDSYVGYYTVANKIPSLITTFSIVFIQAWGISAIKEYEQDTNSRFYNNIFNIFNCFIIFCGSLLLLFIRPFMKVYIDASYYESISYVPMLIISAIILSYANFFGVIFSAQKNSRVIMESSLIAAIINIILNYILIKEMKVIGAVISTVISYFVLAVYRYMKTQKIVSMHPDNKRIIISGLIVITQAIIATLDYNYYFIESVCFALVFLLNIKEIVCYCRIIVTKLRGRGLSK